MLLRLAAAPPKKKKGVDAGACAYIIIIILELHALRIVALHAALRIAAIPPMRIAVFPACICLFVLISRVVISQSNSMQALSSLLIRFCVSSKVGQRHKAA